MKKTLMLTMILIISLLSFSKYSLENYEKNIFSGGVPRDGIPSIDNPKYEAVKKSDRFLDDRDPVFLVEIDGEVKIFPQKILVWHEIVNDVVAGKNISVTYCPLTGTVIGYFIGDTTLGVSGKLVNSNLIMYDRKTRSYFPQILGRAINGSRKGETLDSFNIYWSTWEKAKLEYPRARVLSFKTGYIRNYRKDPYGDYFDPKAYYKRGGALFPIMNEDKKYSEKELVLGIKLDADIIAVRKKSIRKKKVMNIEEEKVILVYDDGIEAPIAFLSTYKGENLEFRLVGSRIYDTNGKLWTIADMREKLEEVLAFESFWFAWSAFYPETRVYE